MYSTIPLRGISDRQSRVEKTSSGQLQPRVRFTKAIMFSVLTTEPLYQIVACRSSRGKRDIVAGVILAEVTLLRGLLNAAIV